MPNTNVRQRIIDMSRLYIDKIKYRLPRNPLEIHTIDSGMSCFHFVKRAFSDVYIFMPKEYGCWEMWNNMEETKNPETGDLVFFEGKSENNPGHVGFYNGKTMIHCSRFFDGVVETDIPSNVKGYRSIEKLICDAYGRIPRND